MFKIHILFLFFFFLIKGFPVSFSGELCISVNETEVGNLQNECKKALSKFKKLKMFKNNEIKCGINKIKKMLILVFELQSAPLIKKALIKYEIENINMCTFQLVDKHIKAWFLYLCCYSCINLNTCTLN